MTTFFAMCYIMVLNGVIIGGPYNTGIPTSGVFFSTALASGIFTTMMGLFVNVPVALAPGMGLNGYFNSIAGNVCYPHNLPPRFTWSVDQQRSYFPGGWPRGPANVNGQGPCDTWGKTNLPWSDAMGAVFISGFFYLFFTFTGFRGVLFKAVPKSLRAAITVGIGFFITIIGLKIGQITRVTQAPWSIGSVVNQAQCHSKLPPNNYGNINSSQVGPTSSTDFYHIGDGFTHIAFCSNAVDLNFVRPPAVLFWASSHAR